MGRDLAGHRLMELSMSNINRFFYSGYSAESLGLFRIYFGIFLFIFHIPQFATLILIDPTGPAFYYLDPIWYFELLGIDKTIPFLNFVAAIVLMASTATFTAGKWTRTSIIVVLITLFYLKGVRDSAAGDIHHRYVVLVQILFFFLISKCGNVMSLDALKNKAVHLTEWEASWPIRAAQVYVAYFYFFAIVAKIRVSGWDWFVDGGRLQEEFIVRSVRWGLSEDGEPLKNTLAFYLASDQFVVFLLCLALIAFELMFPLILFVKRNMVKLLFVAVAFLFHIMNYVLLDVKFHLYGFILAVYFDLAVVRQALIARIGRQTRSELPVK